MIYKKVDQSERRNLRELNYCAMKNIMTLSRKRLVVAAFGRKNTRDSVGNHMPAKGIRFRSHRAHRTLACLTPPIEPLLRRQWPLPPPTGQLSPVLRRRSSLRYASTWARQGRSSVPSPLAFNTTCGGAARWGAAWCGRLPCPRPNQTIVWYSRRRHIRFLALH